MFQIDTLILGGSWMGKEINIYEGKKLKLKNVISFAVTSADEIDIEIEKMKFFVAKLGLKLMGPLIQLVQPLQEGEIKLVFMQQIFEVVKIQNKQYEFFDEIVVEDCLYTRYMGEKEGMGVVYQKLAVYAYEKEKTIKGDSYTILLKDEEESFIMDVFMPIISV